MLALDLNVGLGSQVLVDITGCKISHYACPAFDAALKYEVDSAFHHTGAKLKNTD